ncbi:UNVERIFIED_CONTAM: hypothetical protein FKN15_022192 [Acipenser sinensis]
MVKSFAKFFHREHFKVQAPALEVEESVWGNVVSSAQVEESVWEDVVSSVQVEESVWGDVVSSAQVEESVWGDVVSSAQVLTANILRRSLRHSLSEVPIAMETI